MNNFYFTMSRGENHPFSNGWVRVVAEDIKNAVNIYTKKYGDIFDNNLRYALEYTEEEFKKTSMYKNGNFGEFEHDCLK